MAKDTRQTRNIANRLTAEHIGIVLAVLGLVIAASGHLDQYGSFNMRQLFHDLYANLGAELASIAVTILIIDRLNQRREVRSEKARLIREMGSRDNGTALRAVDELRARGWLHDGSLYHADLKYANMEHAILDGADLENAYLSFANLENADLRNANLRGAILRCANLQGALLLNANLQASKLLEADLQAARLQGADLEGATLTQANLAGARGLADDRLAQAWTLRGATMPNSAIYDGRYNLPGDIEGLDTGDIEAMAAYYGVSAQAYERGQMWARENRV